MTQHPNHNPENLCTSALREMSWEQLKEFFRLYQYNILLRSKSSTIYQMQWDLSIAFYYVLMHRILPVFDIYEGDDSIWTSYNP